MTDAIELAPHWSTTGDDTDAGQPWLYVFGTPGGDAVKVGRVSTEDRLAPRLHEIARRSCRTDLKMLASAPIEDVDRAEAEHVEATVRLWLSRCDDLAPDSRVDDWLIVERQPDEGWQERLDSALHAVMEFAS